MTLYAVVVPSNKGGRERYLVATSPDRRKWFVHSDGRGWKYFEDREAAQSMRDSILAAQSAACAET